MSKSRISIDNPDNEVLWLKCNWCHSKTEHKVLSSVVTEASEDYVDDGGTYEDALWWRASHRIIQCNTCQQISYRRESIDSESDGDEELGIPDQYDVAVYPGDMAHRIFGQYKSQVDKLLFRRCADVIEKVPAIYKRLGEGDKEAISQALTSCRRIISSFAHAIYPPPGKEEEVIVEGKSLKLSAQNYLNLIDAYVRTHTSSISVRDRIRLTLRPLNERVCAGVHDDVTAEEAQALFLQTYLLLGEILNL